MKRASLRELMGGAADRGLSLESLPSILGEAMPELPRNGVGRHRLITALQQRFGSNFRALPGVSNLVKEFDAEIAFEDKVRKVSSIKYRPKEKR